MTSAESRLAEELAQRKLWLVVLEASLEAIIMATAILGNCLVCWAVYRTKRMRTTVNYYVISLAVSDVVMGVVAMPFTEGSAIVGRWIFGHAACQFVGIIIPILALASILNLTIMAVSRYFKIVKPDLHRKWFKRRYVMGAIFLSWLTAILASTPYWRHEQKFHPGKLLCIFDLSKVTKTFALAAPLGFICTPMLIISVSYYKIFHAVSAHNNWVKRQNNLIHPNSRGISVEDVTVTKTILLIIVGFTLCWTPFVVIDIAAVFQGQYTFPRSAYVLYTYMGGLSSAVNPVIYGFMNRRFRSEFKRVVCFTCMRSVIVTDNASKSLELQARRTHRILTVKNAFLSDHNKTDIRPL